MRIVSRFRGVAVDANRTGRLCLFCVLTEHHSQPFLVHLSTVWTALSPAWKTPLLVKIYPCHGPVTLMLDGCCWTRRSQPGSDEFGNGLVGSSSTRVACDRRRQNSLHRRMSPLLSSSFSRDRIVNVFRHQRHNGRRTANEGLFTYVSTTTILPEREGAGGSVPRFSTILQRLVRPLE